jgi:hypothetical protein
MNERIRELAEQAGYSKDYLAIGLPNNMEKFAELIVQECGNIAFEHWALTHDTSSQEVILKYFGIE